MIFGLLFHPDIDETVRNEAVMANNKEYRIILNVFSLFLSTLHVNDNTTEPPQGRAFHCH